MRRFCFITLILLLAASVVAWLASPHADRTGRSTIVWASDDNPARRDQIALFRQRHPQVDLQLDPNNFGIDKVLVQSLSGVGPDVFDSYGAAQLQAYVEAGVAWDITDELARRGITPALTWPLAQSGFMIDGRLYGWPDNVSASGIWYHKDLFDAAGVPYPPRSLTWLQFAEMAQRLTTRANGRVTRYGFMADTGIVLDLMASNGGRIFDARGGRCVLASPANIAAVQFWIDLMYRYQVMPTPQADAAMSTQGGWGSGTITLFGGKRCALAYGARYWLSTLRAYPDLQLGVCEVPHGGERAVRGTVRAALINRHSPRRQQALEFIVHLASAPYSEQVNDQADAFGPLRSLSATPEFRFNPRFPAETYNDVWAGILEQAVPEETTRAVNLDFVQRTLFHQLDLAKNRIKLPADALRSAEDEINRELARQ